MSPRREQALVEAVLRYQVGIDPGRLGPVLDLAAVGIVNSGWRISPVEDWHAGDGPLGDGDMLRVNAHTTWRVREIVRRWRGVVGLAARSPMAVVDRLATDDVDRLLVRVFRWLVDPGRRLPTGVTLAELAGEELGEFTDHVDSSMGDFAATVEERGPQFALLRAAAHGGLACRHWWGTPTWPDLVRTFVRVLDDPGAAHWGPDGSWRSRLSPEPLQVVDRAGFQQILLHRPWDLEPGAAQWVVDAGIGYLRTPLPTLPDDLDLPP